MDFNEIWYQVSTLEVVGWVSLMFVCTSQLQLVLYMQSKLNFIIHILWCWLFSSQ